VSKLANVLVNGLIVLAAVTVIVVGVVQLKDRFARRTSVTRDATLRQRIGVEALPANIQIALGTSHARRAGHPTIALVEFSDYECPFCGQYARSTLPRIVKGFVDPGKLIYVFRNFPLASIHKTAQKAAEAAECAGAQGRFWDMHDWLFSNQDRLAVSNFVAHAGALRLDVESFERCLAGSMTSQIARDVADAKQLGLRSTPSFLVGRLQSNGSIRNATLIRGAQSYDVFKTIFEDALK
jgi:protein-disulfide isomerase